jgi:hypothetical protein
MHLPVQLEPVLRQRPVLLVSLRQRIAAALSFP